MPPHDGWPGRDDATGRRPHSPGPRADPTAPVSSGSLRTCLTTAPFYRTAVEITRVPSRPCAPCVECGRRRAGAGTAGLLRGPGGSWARPAPRGTRSCSEGAHGWVRACRPRCDGCRPAWSVAAARPHPARVGSAAVRSRCPAAAAPSIDAANGEPHTSGKSAATITRSALASSVIWAGVRPRISPSMSRSRGGSVCSQTWRAVRNGVLPDAPRAHVGDVRGEHVGV